MNKHPLSRRTLLWVGTADGLSALAPALAAQARKQTATAPSARIVTVFGAQRRIAVDASRDIVIFDRGQRASLIRAGVTLPLTQDAQPITPQVAPYYVSGCCLGDTTLLLDRKHRRIDRFEADGRFSGSLPLAALTEGPASLRAHDGKLWLTDSAAHRVLQLDPLGRREGEFGGHPWQRTSLNGPSSIAIDAADNLHVLETGHRRISVWQSRGGYLGEYATDLTPGARGMAIDREGHSLLLVDSWEQRTRLFHTGTGREHREAPHLPSSCVEPLSCLSFTPEKGFYLAT
jgi:hypothetical protein